MDVRCTKCGIEYEFDDAKVTTAGVTVKCTSCGHVFKVKREEPIPLGAPSSPPGPPSSPPYSPGSLPPPAAWGSPVSPGTPAGGGSALPGRGETTEWMVKRTDGQVFRFKELTTLQKWIVERKVGRDDEISKTGKTWKRLGEIAELASFFQVVDAATAALTAAQFAATNPPSQPPVIHALGTSPPVMPVPSQPPSTLPPASLPPALAAQPSYPPQPAYPPSYPPQGPTALGAMPTATSLAPQLGPGAGEPVGALPVPRAPGRATGDVDVGRLDQDDPVLQMIHRRRRNAALAFVAALLVVGGAGTAVFWPQVSAALGLAPAAAVAASPAVEDAMRAVRADAADALTAARAALAAPKDAVEAAAQVRVDVALAAHLRAQARALDALGDVAGAKTKKDEAAAALAKAYGTLAKVRAEAPQLVDMHLAAAAYQLEKGALAEMRADLETARTFAHGAGGNAAAAPAVDAEIAVQQALADAEDGLANEPAAALAKIPASDDGRILAAKAALAVAAIKTAIDVDVARSLVEALPAADERRALWLQIVDARAKTLKPGTKTAPAVDAGVAATADAGVKSDAPPAEEESYDVVMQKAERARVNEKSRQAYDLFTKAAKLKPGARPWLGIGWAALDLGKNNEAVRGFQKALSYDESLSDAQFGLAEALKIAGRNDEAKKAYEDYLKMDPNGRDAAIAKRALESMQ